MLLFISGWLIFFLLHLSSNECSLIDSDNYREAYFKLEMITDGKDDHLFNSNAEISCMLDCLSDVNCSKGVFNKSSQSCIASSKPEERGDDVEIWERLPNEMKSTTMPNKVKGMFEHLFTRARGKVTSAWRANACSVVTIAEHASG